MNKEYTENKIIELTLTLKLRTEYSVISFKDKNSLKQLSVTTNSKIEKEKLEALYYTFLAIILSVFLAAIPKVSQLIASLISLFNKDIEILILALELIGFAIVLIWLYIILKKFLIVTISDIEKLYILKGLIKLHIEEY